MAQDDDDAAGAPQFLTTREVADLLRVKERKVYDLAAAGEIPHRRVTNKLLFPRTEIEAWLRGAAAAPRVRPAVLAGSHDPLLDWAIRESGCGLASFTDGSTDGLDRFARGEAALAGLHLPEEEGGWNLAAVAARGLRDSVLIAWASRSQGLILRLKLRGAVRTVAGLRGRRVALRQPGAGSRALFDRMAAKAGLGLGDFEITAGLARTETEAAAAVASGAAEAAMGLETMARQFNLQFSRLAWDRFDLLIDRRSYFTPPVQALLAFARTDAFRARAEEMGGYNLADHGTVRWLSD